MQSCLEGHFENTPQNRMKLLVGVMVLIAVTFLLALIVVLTASGGGDDAESLWADLIPDPVSKVPSSQLRIFYHAGVSALLGNELTVEDTRLEPQITEPTGSLGNSTDRVYYTLVMLDPDAPSRNASQAGRQYLHHLIYDISSEGLDGAAQLQTRGTLLVPYFGPGPPAGTGLHRYVFLVHRQTRGAMGDGLRGPDRANFNWAEWAATNGLEASPAAGNFFQSQATGETTI